MAISDFSVSGWHGFGSVTQVCFGISISIFMCMSFVAVGRSLTILSYVAFKMAALWFWTMFNCNPPIAHCHPLLWGGGILVDHWSTISSLISLPSSGALYISTEDVFPNKRLVQLANNYVSQHYDKLAYRKPTDHVYVEHASEVVSQQRKYPFFIYVSHILCIDSTVKSLI